MSYKTSASTSDISVPVCLVLYCRMPRAKLDGNIRNNILIPWGQAASLLALWASLYYHRGGSPLG